MVTPAACHALHAPQTMCEAGGPAGAMVPERG